MKYCQPALIEKLESCVPLMLSLSFTIFVFIGNLALHPLFMYLYHEVAFRRMVPNFMRLNGKNVPLKPVVSVPRHLNAEAVANRKKQLKTPPTVIAPEDMGTLRRQHRRHSMPATSTMSLNAIEQFDTEDEQDHETQSQAESVLWVLESLT